MPIIWTDDARYRQVEYENEADLEAAIIQVQSCLFGEDRYYLDIKKKIGAKGSIQNIPDGYLLDLSGSKPRLYVVENELAAHDPLRHIVRVLSGESWASICAEVGAQLERQKRFVGLALAAGFLFAIPFLFEE